MQMLLYAGPDDFVLKRLDAWNAEKKGKESGNQNINSTTKERRKEVLPMYQVKRKGMKRSDHFHRLCRLDMARQVRESIALTADMGYDPMPQSSMHSDSNTKHLPKLAYKLPDGSTVDVECEERYNITELWFGRDDENTVIREEACRLHQKKLAMEIAAIEDVKAAAEAAAALATVSSKSENEKSDTNASPQHQEQQTSSFFNSSPSSSNLLSPSFQAPPLSFHPLPNIICDAAFQCDRDQQAQLLANVLLSGGGSCIDNVPERVRDEVEGIIHTHTPVWKVKVLAPPLPERSVSAWLGGSILASLGSFGEMWMTRQEYEESGCGIVNRKCP